VLGAILTLSAGGAVLAVRGLPFLAAVETWLADFRIATLLPAEPQSRDIVVLAITEETLEPFPYRSPLDRRFVAGLLRTLERYGARGILLDLLLDQPTEPDKDAELAKTLAALTVPIVISYAGTAEGLTRRQAETLDRFVPLPLRGFANLVTDPWDGTVRWLYPGRRHEQGAFIPGAASALALKLGHQPAEERLPIAWRGRPDAATASFRSFPAHFLPALPAAWFKDRIVLIGADLTLTDRHRTPFAAALPGREGVLPGIVIHAHALDQLMSGRTAPAIGRQGEAALALLFALLGMLSGSLIQGLGWRLLAAGLVLAGLWVGGYSLFAGTGILVPLLGPSLAFVIAHGLSDAYSSSEARRQRKFIQDAFGRYLSPPLVEQLLHDPSRLTLGGERRHMTILFTDIAGFTHLSEHMEPEQLGQLLNAYFEGICGAVLAHGGMVNEFIGDAVLAFFGAPLEQPDHAARSLACARAIDAFAERFRCERQAEGLGFGITRIGLHTGEVAIGNFGAPDRFKYSALGDTVNTASRIEGLNKHVGSRAMASGTTVAAAADSGARPVGEVVLKGRDEPLPVFELPMATAVNAGPDAYRAAFALLEQGRTAEARAAFEGLAAAFPADALVGFQLGRLRAGAAGTRIVMTEK
jgi:class 3 adenylate cyclase/CHASE2 domain-containing sensor protein